MFLKITILVFILQGFSSMNLVRAQNPSFESEAHLAAWLELTYESAASSHCYRLSSANWDFVTDVNNQSKQAFYEQEVAEVGALRKELWEVFKLINTSEYQSESLKRQVRFLKVLGNAALDADKLAQLTTMQTFMTQTYSDARICRFDNQGCNVEEEGIRLEPDIEAIIASSDNYEELVYVWEEWRKASGAKIRDVYKPYVELSNEAAVANGFEDMGALWRDRYETDNFIEKLDELWDQVKPLYDELHTYVRRKLKEVYGDKIDTSDGMIPANILGNMWAQSWINIGHYVRPFPDASKVDVTAAMAEQGYTVFQMFNVSDDFYQSMGLENNSVSYNEHAMIEQPKNRSVLCHASAWDFCDRQNFRIKMCTNVDMEDFITVHHEMGHIQYFLLYKDQPITFRGGANPGFHEAVGDTIALSVATPQHLEKIGLLPDYEDDDEASINALMDMALERVAFLPFGLLIDKWRWDVFSGTVDESEWNNHWWNYRQLYQKVKSPVQRSANDFDPGAKYHVAGNSQYINYFVAHILQFQMYRGLCKAAGEYDPTSADTKPLHKCDFYQNTEAGNRLREGLSLGSSQHWSEALRLMTGETDLDSTAILEYFQPLYEYLREQNRRIPEDELQQFLEEQYETIAGLIYTLQVHAEWNFATDVANPEKEQAQLEATLNTAEFDKSLWTEVFQYLDEENYEQDIIQRQVRFLRVLGDAALETDKLSELTSAISTMTNIYSTAKICPYEKQDCNLQTEGLNLDPGIENIISTSTNYDELLYAWTEWREVSGAQMKEHFKTYVNLSNMAAEANDFSDKGEMWRSYFESPTFIEDLDNLWEQVEPLYDELHTYVRNKLKERYGDNLDIGEDGLIPAHVLGNMWGQSWINLASLVRPYPDANEIDITAALADKGYNVLKMFQVANEFYTSIGLEDNAISYNVSAGAMITKPADREVLCHASAWDFNDGENFRVKMCTKVDFEDFVTIHHELGHIQYYLLYKDLPITLRTGANPGFHEAVGDTIALSVATPQHFKEIGLLDEYEESEEADINSLMDMALERVAFLPFGLLIDKWRWDVFSGTVLESQWNARWWHYRETIQKVKAPAERTEENFDPGAKFHVAADYQYISYFVAHILEFQFFKALCIEAGQYNPETKDPPLHKCDYYKSLEAGAKLREGLSLGASKHWKEVLEIMTGETEMDASALKEYFDPLYEYLKKANTGVTFKFSRLSCILSVLFVYYIPRLLWYK